MKEQKTEAAEPPQLVLHDTRYGKGVFANRSFSPGEMIIRFRGRMYHKEEYLKRVKQEKCYFLQIDTDWFLGPTRSLDNFVNHSCSPNSGFRVYNRKAYLFALWPIAPDEEVTFDYSTSMAEDHWEMDCQCGSPSCRGRVRDFKYLPAEIQLKYISLQAAPDYVVQSMLRERNSLVDNPSFVPQPLYL